MIPLAIGYFYLRSADAGMLPLWQSWFLIDFAIVVVSYYAGLLLVFRSKDVRIAVPRSRLQRMLDARWGIDSYFPKEAQSESNDSARESSHKGHNGGVIQ